MLNYLQSIVPVFLAYTTYSIGAGMVHMGGVRYMYMLNDREGYFRSVNHIVNQVVYTWVVITFRYNYQYENV